MLVSRSQELLPGDGTISGRVLRMLGPERGYMPTANPGTVGRNTVLQSPRWLRPADGVLWGTRDGDFGVAGRVPLSLSHAEPAASLGHAMMCLGTPCDKLHMALNSP